MTGREILLDARTWFAMGNIEYKRKFRTTKEAKRAHKKSYNAARGLGFQIIRRRGDRGYRFSHHDQYLYIYYTGGSEQ